MEAGAGRVPADDAGHCCQTLLKRPDRRQGEGGSSQGGTAKEQQAVVAGSTGEMLFKMYCQKPDSCQTGERSVNQLWGSWGFLNET